MNAKSKAKYQTKTTTFGKQKVTLYSIDGLTWSSRPNELDAIKERHEAQRITFAQIKGEVKEAQEEQEKESTEEETLDPVAVIDDLDLPEPKKLKTKELAAKRSKPSASATAEQQTQRAKERNRSRKASTPKKSPAKATAKVKAKTQKGTAGKKAANHRKAA